MLECLPHSKTASQFAIPRVFSWFERIERTSNKGSNIFIPCFDAMTAGARTSARLPSGAAHNTGSVGKYLPATRMGLKRDHNSILVRQWDGQDRRRTIGNVGNDEYALCNLPCRQHSIFIMIEFPASVDANRRGTIADGRIVDDQFWKNLFK